MWILLVGLGLLLASGGAGKVTARPAVFWKPEPLPVPLDCSQIPELSTIMAARLLVGAKQQYTKKVMRDWERQWDTVVVDWVYWTLKRDAGLDAPKVPASPWADTLDSLGDPSWAWRHEGSGSVTRRSVHNVFGPYPLDYDNWADVDCLAQLKAGARTAVAQWYTANGLG